MDCDLILSEGLTSSPLFFLIIDEVGRFPSHVEAYGVEVPESRSWMLMGGVAGMSS